MWATITRWKGIRISAYIYYYRLKLLVNSHLLVPRSITVRHSGTTPQSGRSVDLPRYGQIKARLLVNYKLQNSFLTSHKSIFIQSQKYPLFRLWLSRRDLNVELLLLTTDKSLCFSLNYIISMCHVVRVITRCDLSLHPFFYTKNENQHNHGLIKLK